MTRILDLFCGAGGAGEGYNRAGFAVVGVDINPQPNYPFAFWQQDALAVLREERVKVEGQGWQTLDLEQFDAIHASPPCQAHSTLKARNRHVDDPDLIGPTRELLEKTGLPYVIENVPGAPLRDPVTLCGSMFDGVGVMRHRLFETNFPLEPPGECDHERGEPRYLVRNHGKDYLTRWCPVYGTGGKKSSDQWADAMGINWMTRQELSQAIPPAYTEWIGHALLRHLEDNDESAGLRLRTEMPSLCDAGDGQRG